MAKGFTVKADVPKKKKEEFDIAATREMIRGKTIVFCLPGRQNTIVFPRISCLHSAILKSSVFFFFGASAFTVNPFAIT